MSLVRSSTGSAYALVALGMYFLSGVFALCTPRPTAMCAVAGKDHSGAYQRVSIRDDEAYAHFAMKQPNMNMMAHHQVPIHQQMPHYSTSQLHTSPGPMPQQRAPQYRFITAPPHAYTRMNRSIQLADDFPEQEMSRLMSAQNDVPAEIGDSITIA
eukprot:CAMPEP_0195522568 /NCGR_PEP_ID=MMETSP0794_2-20130614/20848_1 /TAXON_ID=515487 /ORGANISM="Stephanopyxis turris, Strain CCMP 815" /LENGTH=155 /DNA_ID=CAMNT_0040652351 /DNA_START=557 /DNA_END=1023 /DNA_ORIENTATION=+